jgi:Na+-translocating ferredoxin:NAD+ oxidoreductase RnfG subunit
LKKLVLLAALVAMAVVAAMPAIAQVTQSPEQKVESGDASQTMTVTGGGDNSSSCQMIQGIDNTGNAVNGVNVLQYDSTGGVSAHGGDFEIDPSQNKNAVKVCDQQVNQAASASGS